MAHPELPSCAACQQWVFLPDSNWSVMRGRDGKPAKQAGKPPCWQCPKLSAEDRRSADAGPHLAAELTPENMRAYHHYRRCKAVGRFPMDPIVEQNAGIIMGVEEDYNRTQQRITLKLLGAGQVR